MIDMFNAMARVTLVVTPFIVLLLALTPLTDKRYEASGRRVLWMLVTACLMLPILPVAPPKAFYL